MLKNFPIFPDITIGFCEGMILGGEHFHKTVDGENSMSNVEVVLDFLICYRVPSMLKPLVKRKIIPVYIRFVNVSKLFKFVYTAENEQGYQK